MSASPNQAMGRYVQVLDQKVQAAQKQAARLHQQLHQTEVQLERLQAAASQAVLKKPNANVALFANAAGFRSSVLEMAEQMRDAYSVQRMECNQAQQVVHQAMQRHASMDSAWQKQVMLHHSELARREQKRGDEMASQAWQRQQVQRMAETPERQSPRV